MVAAHDADADNPNFQRTTHISPAGPWPGSRDSFSLLPTSTPKASLATQTGRNLNTFCFQYLRSAGGAVFCRNARDCGAISRMRSRKTICRALPDGIGRAVWRPAVLFGEMSQRKDRPMRAFAFV